MKFEAKHFFLGWGGGIGRGISCIGPTTYSKLHQSCATKVASIINILSRFFLKEGKNTFLVPLF